MTNCDVSDISFSIPYKELVRIISDSKQSIESGKKIPDILISEICAKFDLANDLLSNNGLNDLRGKLKNFVKMLVLKYKTNSRQLSKVQDLDWCKGNFFLPESFIRIIRSNKGAKDMVQHDTLRAEIISDSTLKEKRRIANAMQIARKNAAKRLQEKKNDAEAKKLIRQDQEKLLLEQQRVRKAMKKAREDGEKRLCEKVKDAEAKKLIRQDQEKLQLEQQRVRKAKKKAREEGDKRLCEKVKDRDAKKLARIHLQKLRVERYQVRIEEQSRLVKNLEIVEDISKTEKRMFLNIPKEVRISDQEQVKNIRKCQTLSIEQGNFNTSVFLDNPLLIAGKTMFLELENIKWDKCEVCLETYPCVRIGPRNRKCKRCANNPHLFALHNDLNPTEAPCCLSRLSPIEKSAISLICPIIGIYRKGISTATKGHTISVMQDVGSLSRELPRLPKDLPYIILKGPNEKNTEQMFRVRREFLIKALDWLKRNSPDYAFITISHKNAGHYPLDDIVQDLPELDPKKLKIPPNAMAVTYLESDMEESSMVQIPDGNDSTLEGIMAHFKLNWPKREQKPASEFIPGFFSKAFPDLFPHGKGDITKPRLGKNPSQKQYFQHLFRLNRKFAEHHCFTFVATNMLRRHAALTIGNVFSKYSAENLTMGELKNLVETGNERIIKKLMYFAAPIPGTRQCLRYQTDKAISLVKFIRITSQDKDMFNFFQTFSAADFHWDDLHRLLPDSSSYLDKRIVDSMSDVPKEEQADCIEKTEDGRQRTLNLQKNADIVDWYFYHRLQALLKHVLPVMGVKDWIIRYEVQARGTIHAHLLVHVKDGPCNQEMIDAFKVLPKLIDPTYKSVSEAQKKIIDFSTQVLGISAIHPNPDPANWPGPYGQNVHTPPSNCLRTRFLSLQNSGQMQEQYEKLINRCMLHNCREGYCLSKSKLDKNHKMICRFHFPFLPHGFEMKFDETGQQLKSVEKTSVGQGKGADFVKDELKFWRNHPTLVHHVPELLVIWGANIEGRPVQSYQQVLRYLLKYMMKPEPNSAPFGAVCKAVVDASKDEEPVRKTFQKILMKTVGEHDLSKQECHHILNGLDFVEYSREFVSVNIMGTKKVKTFVPGDDKQEATDSNWANIYWTKATNPDYLQAVEMYKSGKTTKNPAEISLFQFASQFNKNWKLQNLIRVPHITPSFNYIPRKDGANQSQYILFLESILLLHKPGTTLEEIKALALDQLEALICVFLTTDICPKLVIEEFNESQLCVATNDCEDDDNEHGIMKPFGNEEELFIEPQTVLENFHQDQWMEALKPIHDYEQQFYENETDYDDLDIVVGAQSEDWQADQRNLNLTHEQIHQLPHWINLQKENFNLEKSGEPIEICGTYEHLNEKQKIAFHILDVHIQEAKIRGIKTLKQLLLNISGGAGTGKTFWLNAIRAHATDQINANFIKSAAPSGTAAFLIGGETLHSLLYLPIGKTKLEDLQGERLAEIQRRFSDVGVLIIDEKSMIGQETFWMVSQRLKQARPQKNSEPFGGLSIVLLGDWKQLPPVCDSPLYSNISKNPRGYNLYQLFDKAVIFDDVQRQKGDDQALFRTELQSLGNGTFSEISWMRWQSRALDLLSPAEQESFLQEGILACANKADMVQHNIAKVKANLEAVAPIYAVSSPKEACKASAERACGLSNKIVLSKKTLFRLTANLWTKAGLTNGAIGTVHSIIYAKGVQPPALPIAIIATFPSYKGPPYLKDVLKSVPIVPVCREWFSNKIRCSRTMLPIILGYALSIHKLQGSTCEKLILNPGKTEFASGLLLVGATRTKSFEGLAFAPFPNYSRFAQVNNSKGLKLRLKEEKKMAGQEALTIAEYCISFSNNAVQEIAVDSLSFVCGTEDIVARDNGNYNQLSTVTDQMSPEESVMECFQGVTWGSGSVQNSCTIDNFFTLLSLMSEKIQNNLSESHVEILLKKIICHLVSGNEHEAKVAWSEYLYSEKKNLEVKNEGGKYNLYGTENRMMYQSLSTIYEISCISKCADCKVKNTRFLKEFLLQPSHNITNYLENLNDHIFLGTCRACNSSNLVDQEVKFLTPEPWLFVVNADSNHSLVDIVSAPKTIEICKKAFSLAMISLHNEGHFTALFWYNNSWFQYDGQRNGARFMPVSKYFSEIIAHKPIHVVYLKSIS